MAGSIINLMFPPKCIFCGCILNTDAELEICDSCLREIPFSGNRKIALPLNCQYDELICVCRYSGNIKKSLIGFKFFDKPSYYRTFAKLLSKEVRDSSDYTKLDIITCVPIHRKRMKTRGYNQSLLISKVLFKYTGIPVKTKILSRVKHTESQSLLARSGRYANIRNAFVVRDADIVYDKNILLVDDITTTGSTLNECSRVLKNAGARSVTAAVIASGRIYK